jgi:hypothetical protein
VSPSEAEALASRLDHLRVIVAALEQECPRSVDTEPPSSTSVFRDLGMQGVKLEPFHAARWLR